MSDNRPKVGVGVAVFRDGKLLLGNRLGAHGEGTWSFPGGHLEFGESWEECAAREVKEETNLDVTNVRFLGVTNDVFGGADTGKHYITIYMQADWISSEPEIMEPDRMIAWQWFETDQLPSPLFLPCENLLKSDFWQHLSS